MYEKQKHNIAKIAQIRNSRYETKHTQNKIIK